MNTLNFLNEIETFFDKQISVICTDGQKVTGRLSNYTSEFDNEPDGESITLDTRRGSIEIYTSEIKEVALA